MAKVTIVQRILPHYRIPFFTQLAEALAKDGIELSLVYGQELQGTVPKTFEFDAPWAHRIKNAYFKIFGYEMVWQPCLKMTGGSDLIIVEQANRLLVNYAYLLLRKAGNFKLAYWGHGKNMCIGPGRNKLREYLKRALGRSVDWWFAYTGLSARVASDLGMPLDRITAVMNSIDTEELEEGVRQATPEQLDALKKTLGIRSDNVGVFCGGMNRAKHLDFLLDACVNIKTQLPGFEIIFIGSGPEQHKVEKAAAQYSWVHYVGPKYGLERVAYLMLGKALLMPGLIGLVILDSFVTQVPVFTTDTPGHGPEIDYLEDGLNGVLVHAGEESYSQSVVAYFESVDMQSALRNGCAASAQKYSLKNMVMNFSDGIKRCLPANTVR
jgi:glycosyltransferase involved in cell wall biosynthesis